MGFEYNIIKWFQEISNGFLDIIAELITMLGEQYLFVIVIAFLYFVYNKKLGTSLAYSLFLSATFNNAIKGIVQAQRPFELDLEIVPKRPETATGFSFPSGHSQNSSTFYTSLGLIFKKKKLWVFFGIIIFLIALSRVYLGVHFPHDVVVGVALGISTAVLGNFLFNKYGDNLKTTVILLSTTAIIFFPFLFIFYKSNYEAMSKFRDFYTTYAMFLGFSVAIIIERYYVDFNCNTTLKRRIYRFIIALFLFGLLLLGLKAVFPANSIFFDFIRYFLTALIPIGLFPLTFKKLNLL